VRDHPVEILRRDARREREVTALYARDAKAERAVVFTLDQ
jgi:hypothetical protein